MFTRKLRAKLQSKGSKSARRLLKKRNRKERRFASDLNHRISKAIVAKAKDTGRGIALEHLKGINRRTTVRKANRAERMSWAFADLRAKLEYKARLAGVAVIIVDPRNTSRECSRCGHISKSNRRSQSKFQCQACGMSRNADTNAARVIASRAVVNQPNAVYSLRRDEPQAA
ncbi:MAG TPA: transposase [Blastocatellia bacterium]|nr:transposase [Blastocatellia bacterium]